MGFLDGLFSGAASGLVETVGKAIDNIVTSDEERLKIQETLKKIALQHEKDMAALAVEKERLLFADIDSARDNQSRVQETEHASWLSKNIQPMLAFIFPILTICLFYMALAGKFPINEHTVPIIMFILGHLSADVGQIIGYFFGASTDANNLKGKFSLKK